MLHIESIYVEEVNGSPTYTYSIIDDTPFVGEYEPSGARFIFELHRMILRRIRKNYDSRANISTSLADGRISVAVWTKKSKCQPQDFVTLVGDTIADLSRIFLYGGKRGYRVYA